MSGFDTRRVGSGVSKRAYRPDRPDRETHRPKIGIALSCGGAKGLAHIGVIQVLEENRIPITAIAGSSMGAYVGSLWAKGCNGEQLEALASEMSTPRSLWRLADPAFPPMRGLFHGRKAKRHLMEMLGDVSFDTLQRSLFVTATDVDTQERVVFRKGGVAEAVHASCAMPGVICPVTVDGRRCTDGGVVDPVPVGVLRKFADIDHVIAVTVIPDLGDIDRCARRATVESHEEPLAKRFAIALNRRVNLLAPGNIIDTLRTSVTAAQVRIAHDATKRADVVVRPVFCDSAWHDFHNYRKYIALGRQHATEALPLLKALASPSPSPSPTHHCPIQ